MPTISVMMPVYNAERYVAQAVQSVLDQTYTDFEFLIVDDGSTDRSLAILQGFAAKDSRIRLISRPNTGYVVALNEMLELAQGEFIARMDADDIAMPERFDKQAKFLMDTSECVAVGCAIEYVDPDGLPLMSIYPPSSHEEIDKIHMTTGQPTIWHPAAFLRSIVLKQINGYRPETECAEDFDLWLRLAEVGTLANLPDLLLQYRQHPKSVTATRKAACEIAGRKALRDACLRRGFAYSQRLSAPECSRTVNGGALYQLWGWWALKSGHLNTARKYAWLSLWSSPGVGSLKLLMCTFRGF